MAQNVIERLRALCGGSRDGALLRYSLANALMAQGDAAAAAVEARRSLEFDPDYSAAWKLLGRALVETSDLDAARRAWRAGIETAMRIGDVQAQKEMQVFLKRLEKQIGDNAGHDDTQDN